MKLNRRRSAPPSETIVALIDVVFFLLVFFMLIGRMDATAPFAVLPPVAGSGSDLPAGGATLSVGADGALALNAVPMAGPEQVQARLAGLHAADPGLRLRVNAHRDAPLRHVLPLVGQAEALGIGEVVLIVTPEVPRR